MRHRKESPVPENTDEETDRQAEIADVTGMTMLELLQSRDELVTGGVQRLLAEHQVQPITASWSSFLDPGERPTGPSGAS